MVNFLQFTPFTDYKFWLLIWSFLIMIILAGMYETPEKDVNTAERIDMFLSGGMMVFITPICMILPPLLPIHILVIFLSVIFLYHYLTRHKI